MINLGDTVKDTVTGFSGIVTSRCEYTTGVPRCLVEATELSDGKPVERWFDEPRLHSRHG